MVRSRCQSNSNRIFLDLCTSPALRSKYQQAQNGPGLQNKMLPTLKSMKSNSCSNLVGLSLNMIQPSISGNDETDQTEQLERTTDRPLSLLIAKKSNDSIKSTSIPLVPTESTGFIVQVSKLSTKRSIPEFNTTSVNHSKINDEQSLSLDKQPSLENSSLNYNNKAVSLPSTTFKDKKNQDYISRLRHRLNLRGHLRKLFFS